MWVDRFPPFATLPDGVWAFGTTKYYCSSKNFSLLANWAKVYVDLDGERKALTYSELARLALRERLDFLGKKTGNFYPGESLSHPLYARPGIYEDYVYADIKNAYHSIMRLSYPCVFSIRHEIISKPYFISDRLSNLSSKPSRVSAFGVIRSSAIELYKKKGPEITVCRRVRNVFRDDTPRLIYYILHYLAFCALRMNAIYVHTDGFIIKRSQYEYLKEEAQRFGLDLRVKGEGDVIVKGAGCYKIGEVFTKNFDRIEEREFDNINKEWNHGLLRLLSSLYSGRVGL